MKYVINKNDSNQILYKVERKVGEQIEVSGVNFRVKKIINAQDIKEASKKIIIKEEQDSKSYISYFQFRNDKNGCLTGTVLHIDADETYLEKCCSLYKSVGIYAFPMLVEEHKMSQEINEMNVDFCPDVVVVTGHDYFNGDDKKNINNYTNSKYFADAVFTARKKYPNSIIIAGACQSLFEILIAKGANFASSPARKNIHVYDPAIIAINACITSQKKIIDFSNIKKHIIDIDSAFGGIETFGKMRKMY